MSKKQDSVPTIDSEPVESNLTKPRSASGQVHPATESYGSVPLEDRIGRDLLIRTRMCFCPDSEATDCRFHGQDEPGWATCPTQEGAKKNRTLGRWLWARNPRYGQVPTDEEMTQYNIDKQKLEAEQAAKAKSKE